MRSRLTISPLAALMLTTSAYAQQPAVQGPCVARGEPGVEYLQKVVHQYHPEALAPAAQRDSVIVGFVFDSTCQVVRHAVARYGPDSTSTVDAELAKLFPNLSRTELRSAGGWAREPFVPGHLLVVWGMLKRT